MQASIVLEWTWRVSIVLCVLFAIVAAIVGAVQHRQTQVVGKAVPVLWILSLSLFAVFLITVISWLVVHGRVLRNALKQAS